MYGAAKFVHLAVEKKGRPMSTDFPDRKDLRKAGHDYHTGLYFITICVQNREPVFCSIRNGLCELSAVGKIAAACWQSIPTVHAQVYLDEWIIMPDHIHGIIGINTEGSNPVIDLPMVIQQYKRIVTIRAQRERVAIPRPLWQKSYYDRIIRTEKELISTREYIRTNPIRWKKM